MRPLLLALVCVVACLVCVPVEAGHGCLGRVLHGAGRTAKAPLKFVKHRAKARQERRAGRGC